MGHHINSKEEFKSDIDMKPKLNPDGTLKPDKIYLSFKDPAALRALRVFAEWTTDRELGEDILTRLDSMETEA